MLNIRLLVVSFYLALLPIAGVAQVSPQITKVSPASGSPGAFITVYGSGFGASQGSVTIGGAPAQINNWSDGQIIAIVPTSAQGNGLTVSTSGGVQSNVGAFTVLPPSTFSGPVNYIYDELGRLAAVIAASGDAAAYTYDAVGNILSIQRYSSSQVAVIAFAPTHGAVGATVTISGTGFSTTANQNAVSFNGAAATVVSSTSTQIVATVPAGAVNGPVTVTSPLGSAVSAEAFHVDSSTGAPVINSFSPIMGGAGATVTVYGSNFDATPANNHLRFNDVANAIVSASTSTSMTATVPSAAGSGKMKLATPAGGTTSANDFFVPFLSYPTSAIGQTGRMTVGTTQLVSLGAGQIAIFVFEGTRRQKLSLQLTNSTLVGAVANILRPDGTVFKSTTFTNSDLNFTIAPLPVTGTYAVGISAQSAGSVSAQLTGTVDVDVPITIDGPAVTTTTSTSGQDVWLRFSTTAGKQIVLQVTGVSVAAATIELDGPTGEPLTLQPVNNFPINNNPAGQLFFLDQQTLPVTGNYAVHIAHSVNYVGSETTQIFSAQDFVSTITPGGAAVRVPSSGDTIIGQNGRLTFAASAGQKVSLNVTSSSYGPGDSSCTVSIKDPSGTALSAISCSSGPNNYMDTVTLATAGTYSVFVDPQQRISGNATIQLNDASDVTGTIGIDGAPATATTSVQGQDARVSFNGTAGQKVFVQVNNVTNPGATVILLKPDGTQVASVAIGPSCSPCFINTQTLDTSGTYVLWVRHLINYTGSETLQVTSAADIIGTIAIDGSAVTATTTAKGQDARITFSATAGQRIFTQVTSVTNPSATAVLLRPDGTQQASTSVNNSPGQTFWIDTQTLASAGTYTLWIQHSGTSTGSETLQIKSVPADFSSAITIGGSAVRVPASGNNALGQNANLTVSATAGQKFSINLSSDTYSPLTACFLTATDPNGNTVATGNCGSGASPIFMSAATAGTYNLFIDPQGMTLGTATFALASNNDVTGTMSIDGPSITATTTTAGQDARITFPGSAGQRVFLRVTTVTNPSAFVALVRPDNTIQATISIASSPSGQVFFIDTQTLATTGTYTLWVQHSGTNFGSETLQLNSVPNDITGSITLGGAPVRVPSSGDTVLGQNAVLSFAATAGQKASMSISNGTYSPSTNCIVSIKNPAGTQLTSGNCGSGASPFIDAVSLSSTGTYTVLVDPQGTATGNTTVQLNDSSDITGIIPTDGTAVTVATALGQDARYTFAATAGQRVALRVTNVTIPSATVLLIQPNGFTQTSFSINNNPAGQLFFMDTQTLATAGTYTVLVKHSGANTGSVTLQLNTVPADYSAALTLGVVTPVPASGALTIGQNARLTFTGTGGYQANIQFTNNSIGPVTATLLSTDGTTALTSTSSSAASFALPLAMLPANGTYTLLIDPTGAAVGGLSVQVTQVGGANPIPNRSGTAIDPSNPLSWNLAGLFLMNEGTGTTDKNIIDNQTAVFSGTTLPIWNTSDPSVVVRGTGTPLSSYLDAGTDLNFDQLPTNKITVVAKVFLNSLSKSGIVEKMDTGLTGFTFGLDSTGALSGYVFKSSTPMQISTGAGAISAGQWAQVAFTWDGTNGTASAAHIYVNGVEQGKAVAQDGTGILSYAGATNKPFRIGNGSIFGDSGSLNGKVAYVAVYKYRVLSATELSQLDAQLPITTAVVGVTTENGAPSTVTTTTSGQNAHVKFQGWTGQQVTAQLSNNTVGLVTVNLIAPDGSTLTSTSSSASSFALANAALPLDGTYDVLMQSAANAGSITVAVSTTTGGRANGSVIDTSNPLSTNLVGLFLLSEGTGTTDKNIVDNQTAAFSGTALPVWNTNDPSVAMNGTTTSLSSYLDAGTDLNFDQLPTSKMTLVAKVFLNSLTTGGIAEKTDDSAAGFVFLSTGTGALTSYVLKSSTAMQVSTAPGAVTSGQWVQLAFTWDGTVGTAAAAHFFVNGVEQAKVVSQDGSGTISYAGATNKSFRLGNASYFTTLGSLNGRMLYLAVYRGRILTTTELNQLDAQLPIR